MFKNLLRSFGRPQSPATPPVSELEPSSESPVVDVSDADFANVVLAAERLAVVDFWADWCQPCEIMSAYAGFLATDYADQVLVAMLDVDENPATPERFQVMGLPTLLLLKDGEEVDRIVGVVAYAEIKGRIERWIGS